MTLSDDPPGPLITRIARIVSGAPGGGIHRYDLAERCGLTDSSKAFTSALLAAYGRRLVDFCGWQYVVAPASSRTRTTRPMIEYTATSGLVAP